MTFSAWNPGLTSDIPARLMPLATLYRSEYALVSYSEARAGSEFCGLDPKRLTAFTLERLIVHELMIRVTGSLTVPDGPSYEELGINLRGMVAALNTHIAPQFDTICASFEAFMIRVDETLRAVLAPALVPPPAPEKPGFVDRLLGKQSNKTPVDPIEHALAQWRKCQSGDELTDACQMALTDVVEGIIATRGRLVPDADLIVALAARLVRANQGSREVGRLIEPHFQSGVDTLGYRRLPPQAKPVIMNVKGSSAAGKSTIRPAQRKLAEKLGTPWEDFALISPDYWRKYLLDYESLGDDFKYGAMLTGHELEIIDRKLDAYMTERHANDKTPHLLIDRFRFDSFVSEEDSTLLTRFGNRVFMFFMVTPPAATVDRAWSRGLTTGRFKAVDDLLYHNIEAYEGMRNLFFSWIASREREIHFEFLDNSVALGEQPKTIAYGTAQQMVVLDVESMRDITRFAHVNINATRPQDALFEPDSAGLDFLAQCVERIPEVVFVDPKRRDVLGRTRAGKWVTRDECLVELDELDLPQGKSEPAGDLESEGHLLGA